MLETPLIPSVYGVEQWSATGGPWFESESRKAENWIVNISYLTTFVIYGNSKYYYIISLLLLLENVCFILLIKFR